MNDDFQKWMEATFRRGKHEILAGFNVVVEPSDLKFRMTMTAEQAQRLAMYLFEISSDDEPTKR